MCLAIPGKVLEISQNNGLRTGRVNFGGIVSQACLDYVPEVQTGDYVTVHVGDLQRQSRSSKAPF